MNFTVETRSVTFSEGTSQKIVSLSGGHTTIPNVSATLQNETNANFEMYVFNITQTAVVVRLSAFAPLDLTVNIHAISRS